MVFFDAVFLSLKSLADADPLYLESSESLDLYLVSVFDLEAAPLLIVRPRPRTEAGA